MARLNVHTDLAILVIAASGAVIIDSVKANSCADTYSLYDNHTNIIPEALSEAERIWNECILVAADVSPTPPP
ncbi:hypothetical protein EPI10_002645 [Gossypium australe]|uniref:Uncharacterized protein n=1 Tax=Gossypium australe TaxID=47621 RepID=A0A5B6VEW2_9ROSI|nr:hypothetical protein EPI10_002645 [Gossypium australe]